ncbi:PREDICTED: platelet binding protein GspB-like, partial [Rhagoletis zephyria]|uniref:platelet binding protein GspB-like n=1 Tax=Rhagoletis zephyria TaxID=28612 RepID=UPI0008119811
STTGSVFDSPANKSEHEAANQTDFSQSSSDSEVHPMTTIPSFHASSNFSIVDSVSNFSSSNQNDLENAEQSTTQTFESFAPTDPSLILTTEKQQELLFAIEPVFTEKSLASSYADEQLTPTKPASVLDSSVSNANINDQKEGFSIEAQTELTSQLTLANSVSNGENPATGTEQPPAPAETTTPFSAECKTDAAPSVENGTQAEVKEATAVEDTEELTGQSESLLSQRSTDGQDASEQSEQVPDEGHSVSITQSDITTVRSEEANSLPTEATVNVPVTASIETSHESLIANDLAETTDEMAPNTGETGSTELTIAEMTTTPLSIEVTPTSIADAVTLTNKPISSAESLETSTESADSTPPSVLEYNTTHRLSSASVLRTHSSATVTNASFFLVTLFAIIMAHCLVINI